MRASTTGATRYYDHAPLHSYSDGCNQVCSGIRYITTPICHYDNTFDRWF